MISLAPKSSTEIASGKDDAYLRQLAQKLKGVPGDILLRYGWEMDGHWNQNTVQSPELYKQAWQHMHDIFQQEGVNNVKWVWCPDANAFDGKNVASQYYPGSKYVDYIGADGYSEAIYQGNELKYTTPQQIFQSGVNFAKANDKPFLIGETGVQVDQNPANDARYVSEMQAWAKTQPNVKAIVWFESNPKQNGTEENNWMVDSSQEELDAMKKLANDPYFGKMPYA